MFHTILKLLNSRIKELNQGEIEHIMVIPPLLLWMRRQTYNFPAHTLRNNDVVITSKRRHFDVITSKWRCFDVITTLLLHHVFSGLGRTLVGNKIVDHSDVVGASPNYIFILDLTLASVD